MATNKDILLLRQAGRVLRSAVFRPLTHGFFRRRAPIVFYHGVWPSHADQVRIFDGTTLEEFRNDMTILRAHFRFVSLDELLSQNARGARWNEPVVSVCFDDGHDMFRTGAIDILREFKINATVFIIVNCVGSEHLMWRHKLAAVHALRGFKLLSRTYNQVVARRRVGPPVASIRELGTATRAWPNKLKDEIAQDIYEGCDMPAITEFLEEHRPYMSWEELQTWTREGHAVGLHTRTHPYCSTLPLDELRNEIVSAAEEIRRTLGLASLPFAYPFGDRLLGAELEAEVCSAAQLSTMLGIAGISKLGTHPVRLERAEGGAGIEDRVFARPLLQAFLHRS